MNMGYGIKHYVLKEEASLPSIGYNDVVQRMIQNNTREWLPWSKSGLPLQVKSQPEIKKLLLGKESVKQAIAQLVKEKLAYYQGTLHLDVAEDKVYREVEKVAIKNIDTIISNYNHRALRWMAQVMKLVFTSVYK